MRRVVCLFSGEERGLGRNRRSRQEEIGQDILQFLCADAFHIGEIFRKDESIPGLAEIIMECLCGRRADAGQGIQCIKIGCQGIDVARVWRRGGLWRNGGRSGKMLGFHRLKIYNGIDG